MTDFGANIFDDTTAAPPRPAPLPPPAAAVPAADVPAADMPPRPAPARHQQHTRFAPPGRDEPPADARSHAEPRPSRRDDRAREPERAAAPRHPAATARAGSSVALLVDLDTLHQQARAQRRELAMHRLARALAGDRRVAQAIAFTSGDCTPPAGFQLQPGSQDATSTDRFAAAAERLAHAHGAVLLAPATPAAHQLAVRLRRAGHHIELASLQPGTTPDDVRQLGRDCTFVP